MQFLSLQFHPEDIIENKSTEDSKTSTNASYVSDGSPPHQPQPRSRRTYKTWINVEKYPSYDDALRKIKSEKAWSTYSKSDNAVLFRCSKVRSRTKQCDASLRILLSDFDLSVTIQATTNPHTCDQLEKAIPKLTDNVKAFIKEQHLKGLKRKGIEDEFIKAGIPLPAKYVLKNEIARLNKELHGPPTLKVSELHKLLTDHLEIPADEMTGFVLAQQIIEEPEVKFNFVVSTKKLLSINLNSLVYNADTTYKLLWQGFPVIVNGHTDFNKTFHPSCISVSTTEATEDFQFTFAAVKNGTKEALDEVLAPKIIMCDAAKAISNGFRAVYGDDIIELMCWYHAKVAMIENITHTIPKELKDNVISDIDILHFAQTPAIFDKASKLFVQKYEEYEDFITYFKEQWLELHPNWYEGACADINVKAPSCNNGLEIFNRTIKDEKTLRQRLPLQKFITQLLQWVESWSRRYEADLSVYSFAPVVELPLLTKAYQWVKLNKKVKQHKDGFMMVPANKAEISEWHLTSQWETFDMFRTNAFKGWTTVVPANNEWIHGYCNCPAYLRDYMCKHVVGLAIRLKYLDPGFAAKQIPIGAKRKRGRPQNAKKAKFIQ